MLTARFWNIAFRTAHIAAMGVLLGGHAFDLPRERLLPALWLTVGSGLILAGLETGGRLVWFHQGRGIFTLVKLGLLCSVPFLWPYWSARFAVLMTVVVLASVGSHAPARVRYYSVIYREVIRCHDGPGVSRLDEDSDGMEG